MKRKYTDEEVWDLMKGRIYANSDDANIFVKRKVAGWTVNYGNKWTWAIISAWLVLVYLAIGYVI